MIKRTTWFVAGLAVFIVLLGNPFKAHTQIINSPPEKIPAQSPVSEANSKPTLEQIEKGRALLVKIVKVLETVPLMDADAVMAEFGAGEVEYEAYPTHVRATPKRSDEFLKESGLAGLSVTPWERGRRFANLNMIFDSAACIQKNDIDLIFGLPNRSAPIVLIDRVPLGRDFYPTGFSYSVARTPYVGLVVSMSFGFYSEFCAEDFGASYLKKGKNK